MDLTLDQAIAIAFGHYSAGNFQEAKFFCDQIIEQDPQNSNAIYMAGMIEGHFGNMHKAVDLLKRAVSLQPGQLEVQFNLGACHEELGQNEEALQCYKKIASLDSKYFPAHLKIGLICQKLRRFEEAVIAYEHALALDPGAAAIYNNLGSIYTAMGEYEKAESILGKGLNVAAEQKQYFAETFKVLGDCYFSNLSQQKALENYKIAVALRPEYYDSHLGAAMTLALLNKPCEAVKHYDLASKLQPERIIPRWCKCSANLSICYFNKEEIEKSRKNYSKSLQELDEFITLTKQSQIDEAAAVVGIMQPFYLPCQGRNDRELQEKFGSLANRIMSKKFPQWSKPIPLIAPRPGDRIKVGFVSSFFRSHSLWKVFLSGFAESIDRIDFQLFAYHTSGIEDDVTEKARKSFDSFFSATQFEQLCQRIRDDDLHVLIFLENGMDAMTFRLANLRLAPVQCMTWGHPNTSGLPTMDYFLSSDLIEPENAQDHYSEKLVRLPNLSVYYSPQGLTPDPSRLKSYGLRRGSKHYLCLQALHKYLPQYDWVFPRIASQVEDSQFIFVSNPAEALDSMNLRLKNAFAEVGMDSKDFVTFMPPMSNNEFCALCQEGEIYLDTFEWSGGTTTLEALEQNCIPITLPGNFMRGRFTSAMLRMIGVTETIASSIDEYIEIAVQLRQDTNMRTELKKKIENNQDRLYHDLESTRGLERFLKGLFDNC